MSFCSNCGNSLDPSANFCKSCGAAVIARSDSSVVTTPPVRSTRSKVLGFVGMGLSIGGVVMSVIGLLYTFLGLAAEGGLAFIFSIIFSIYSMPLSIVGGILSDKARAMGNYSAVCSVGSKLRIAGIIVSSVMLLIGFMGLLGNLVGTMF